MWLVFLIMNGVALRSIIEIILDDEGKGSPSLWRNLDFIE